MKYAVMIKSSKYGLRIFLDAKAPYEEVKEQLRERFVALRKFLKHATMAFRMTRKAGNFIVTLSWTKRAR